MVDFLFLIAMCNHTIYSIAIEGGAVTHGLPDTVIEKMGESNAMDFLHDAFTEVHDIHLDQVLSITCG